MPQPALSAAKLRAHSPAKARATSLPGRNAATLEKLAAEITAQGGTAVAHVVGATNADAVAAYLDQVAESTGRIDVAFNAIGLPPAELNYPAPSASLSLDQFMTPLRVILGGTFVTARTAATHMARQKSGSIITLSATLSVMAAPNMANIVAACGAIEALTRALAGEFGGSGVRVNCVRGNAMPETRPIQETGAGLVALGNAPSIVPPLGRPITVAETANTVAFLASDLASGIIGQVVTVSAGAFV